MSFFVGKPRPTRRGKSQVKKGVEKQEEFDRGATQIRSSDTVERIKGERIKSPIEWEGGKKPSSTEKGRTPNASVFHIRTKSHQVQLLSCKGGTRCSF